MDNQDKNLKIISWNTNSINNKKHELLDYIEQHNPEIELVQETNLKPADRFYIANYSIYRTDR